jgi:hypothetical protein
VFEPGSRYYGLETTTLAVTDPDGLPRRIAYTRRRFIPPLADATRVVEHGFAAGERLDTITARYLGDPTQFWRLCDAAGVLVPDELEAPGRIVPITMARS